ncbi:uncharacterized protein LOC126373205 [Pectinophora gossypiella]|uniref:uncharacterized protein LOC126373205 n=1 Tax=Pectinophora gossypiella TaxID=13191 RepID=UPI00214E8696|nr:uncharacterized protein LOC126373205 [Pectinophora gossypiella]
MRTEVPEFQRCCFCLPVRYGLLIWGYLVLIPNSLLVLGDFFECLYLTRYAFNFHWLIIVRFTVTFAIKILNFIFTFLLIVAAHKKNSRLLKIYYCCELYAVAAMFVIVISDMVFDLIDMWEYGYIWKYILWLTLVGILYVGLQLYILAITRSEILKLDSHQQFRFTNIAAEAECQYYAKQEDMHTARQENTQTDKEEDEQLNIDTMKNNIETV